jgi:hypothetical protein
MALTATGVFILAAIMAGLGRERLGKTFELLGKLP